MCSRRIMRCAGCQDLPSSSMHDMDRRSIGDRGRPGDVEVVADSIHVPPCAPVPAFDLPDGGRPVVGWRARVRPAGRPAAARSPPVSSIRNKMHACICALFDTHIDVSPSVVSRPLLVLLH